MRNIILAVTGLFLLVGCSQANTATTEDNLTIFGRLSKLVELGSTEETVTYKSPIGDYLVSINAEVLEARPALLNLSIIEAESGIVRDDLAVSLQLCTAVDLKMWGARCDSANTPLYIHNITMEPIDGTYFSETFEWERYGGWQTIVTIEEEGKEAVTETFWTDVYPKRPPSSNAFELTNISLPFIVIGLFLLAARLRKWELIRPIDPAIDHTDLE